MSSLKLVVMVLGHLLFEVGRSTHILLYNNLALHLQMVVGHNGALSLVLRKNLESNQSMFYLCS